MDLNNKESKVVCIIPARGGSKGIPRKNIKLLGSKPLISYTIAAALGSEKVDHVYVSTDSEEIASVAEQYGAKVILRPADLSGDSASSELALMHALDVIEASGVLIDLVVFLQCTSPFRLSEDVDQAIIKLDQDGADSLLSAVPSHKFLWEIRDGAAIAVNYDFRSRPRRQDMHPQFVENGSIYVFRPWVLRKLKNRLGGKISIYPMSEKCSLDIDSVDDWERAESILKDIFN